MSDYRIINHFYQYNQKKLVQDIMNMYYKQDFCIINYIYGAILVNQDLVGRWKTYNNVSMQQVFEDSDFLLPDGAAIRTMYAIGRLFNRRNWPTTLYNLNGTDFLPYFLDMITHQWIHINLITLTVYDSNPDHHNPQGALKKNINKYITNRRPIMRQYNVEVEYNDNNYTWFDRSWIQAFLESNTKTSWSINILLNFRWWWGRWIPHQELFAYLNKESIKKHKILCMNQGATVDFWIGKETRAPKRIRRLRLESLYRVVTDPQKNRTKFRVSFKVIGLIISKIILKG